MKGLFLGIYSILLFSVCSLSSAAPAQTVSLPDLIASGKNVVILFHTEDDETRMANSIEDGGNEFYADWSFGFNSFAAKQNPQPMLYRMTVAEGRQLLGSKDAPKDGWSMAFLKKDKPALYCAKPLMEVDQYDIVSLYFSDKEKTVDAKDYGCTYLPVGGKK